MAYRKLFGYEGVKAVNFIRTEAGRQDGFISQEWKGRLHGNMENENIRKWKKEDAKHFS